MIAGRGILWAHLFENESMGVPRDVYWGFRLSGLQGEEIEAGEPSAINCEWLTFSARRSTELAGLSLDDCLKPDLVEFSIYHGAEHHLVRLSTLSFEVAPDDALTLRAVLHPSDAAAGRIEIEGIVRFDGAIIVPQSFQPPPTTVDDASGLIAPHLDLDTLEPPVWDRFRYLFKPKLG